MYELAWCQRQEWAIIELKIFKPFCMLMIYLKLVEVKIETERTWAIHQARSIHQIKKMRAVYVQIAETTIRSQQCQFNNKPWTVIFTIKIP